MDKICTFLWFDKEAEEAAELYTSLFKDSEVVSKSHYSEGVSGTEPGSVMTVNFRLAGRDFIALNAGPEFKFSEAISLYVNCEDQAEVDRLWDAFLTSGAEESVCGWLKDRYGLSWQIIPEQLPNLVGGPDPAGSKRATEAMLQMKKIDLEALERAYKG